MTAKLVGYFENWAQYRPGGGKCFPEQIDPSLFTHINFAFGLFGFVTWSVDPTATRTGDQRLTGDYRIQPVEWNDQTVLYPALQQLKEKNPDLKTLLSIGGWSINSCDDQPNPGNLHPYGPYTCHLFSHMAADPQGRQQFIQSAIAYAHQYGFDGIDIDWEYPGYMGRGGSEADFENFLRLIQEFRAQAGPDFLLTWAAPAIVSTGGATDSPHNDPTTYFQWVAQCAQSFDWLNVMSYDFHGAFDDPVQVGTGVNAPLLQDSTPHGPLSIKNTVESYLNAGIPKDKIVLGMPTYGRSFTVSSPLTATDHGYGKPFRSAGPAGPATQVPGVLAYYEILAQLASGELTEAWDEATLTPYAYNRATGVWVSYDNAQSLAYKVSYLCEQVLGGAMVWAIDNDAFSDGFPLLRAIQETLADPVRRPTLPVLTSVQSADIWWSGDQQLSPEVGLSEAPGLVAYHDKLYCLHQGKDDWLWLTVFDGTTWSADTPVTTSGGSGKVGITGAPGLAVYQDKLYCLHQGQKQDGWLWLTVFDGTTWSADTKVVTVGGASNAVGLSSAPALAVYQDKLCCLHQGQKQDGWLWLTVFDGTTWSADTKVQTSGTSPNVGITGAPALAVYQDKLYCLHQGQKQDGWLWLTVFDGTTWSADAKVVTAGGASNAVGLSSAPALAVYQDKLYCLHQGHGDDGWLWLTAFDGTTWSADAKVQTLGARPNVGITATPGLGVYQDKLYCLHEGQGKDAGTLWFTIGTRPTRWSGQQQESLAGGIVDSPAVAVYQDKLYCLHQGQKQDGWLWLTVFDGTTWSADAKVVTAGGASNAVGLSSAPALAVYQDKLYCLHQGHGDDGWLWLTAFDGRTWSADTEVGTVGTSANVGISGGPAAAVFRDHLYALHQGQKRDSRLWLTFFDGRTWAPDETLTTEGGAGRAVTTSAPPAAAVFQDTFYAVYNQNGMLAYTIGAVGTGAIPGVAPISGGIDDGEVIALRAYNKAFVSTPSNSQITPSSPDIENDTARFTVEHLTDSTKVSLKAHNGKYLTIAGSSEGILTASASSSAEPDAQFDVFLTGSNMVAIRANNGKFLTVTGQPQHDELRERDLLAGKLVIAAVAAGSGIAAQYLIVFLKNTSGKWPGILSTVAKELRQDFSGTISKYWNLVGKNFSQEEWAVVVKTFGVDLTKYAQVVEVYARVYLEVRYMTDVEQQNAVRHVIWQCLLKKKFEEDFAKQIGDAHEKARPGTPADNEADEFNNIKGSQLADQVPSEEQCLVRAYEMWEAGELKDRGPLRSHV